MKKVIQFVTQGWFLALLAIILLAAVVWFIGPVIAIADYKPLESDISRLGVIFVVLVLWGLNNLRVNRSARQSEKALEQVIDEPLPAKPGEQPSEESSHEEQVLGSRLRDAINLMQGQKSRLGLGGNKLYSLPWYMIIGAPGSGKTTALKNSGLEFPLKNQMGDDPVQGAGGTLYCDWWFTDQAIFIDTAGRYTTQDNPRKIESHAWLAFLSRLKKARPKRPLSGILVAVSIEDLLSKTDTQLSLQTTAIKQRIQELNAHLHMELPVYVIFTKMDRLVGFNSFFGGMDDEPRQQPWGITFEELGASKARQILEQFPKQYNALVQRMNHQVRGRLHDESSATKRNLIFEFPRQMQVLEASIAGFLGNIFSPNQFEEPFILRGVYFVSGTQAALPSRWAGGVIGADYCTSPAERPARESRSYFVQNLLKNVIFAEADLASLNARVRQRNQWLYRGAMLVGLSGFAGMLYAWNNSKNINESYLAQVEQSVQQYQQESGGSLEQPSDWLTLSRSMDTLRDAPSGYNDSDSEPEVAEGFGLYQGQKVGAQLKATYLDALSAYFMRDVATMMAAQIRTSQEDDELLYESLKFYLMLFNAEHMEPKGFVSWADILWQRLLPGEFNQPLRDNLNSHLQQALANARYPLAMNDEVVASARDILARTPLDQRLYRRLKYDALAAGGGEFDIDKVLGKKAEIIFYRRSGKELNDGIPGFFTYSGFHTNFNVQRQRMAQRLADEQWIYGDELHSELSDDDIKAISKRVGEYYYTEYAQRWDDYLSDLRIRSFSTVDGGQAVLRMLAGADQPLVKVLDAVRKNTALSEIPGSTLSDDKKEALNQATEEFGPNEINRLKRLVPASVMGDIALPGKPVSDHFSDLNDYTSEAKGRQLDQLQNSFNGLYDYFQSLSYSDDMKATAFQASLNSQPGSQALNAVKQATAEAPGLVRSWFDSVARNTSQVTVVAAKGHLNDIWKSDVIGFYNVALKGRYPINPNSSQDIRLADFTTFFGPGGMLDGYFAEYIAPFADTSRTPWKWKKNIGLSVASLRMFEKANKIQRAWFNGGDALQVPMTLKPDTLDGTAIGSTLNIDGASMTYKHGPVRSSEILWPGTEQTSRLTFSLASRGTPVSGGVDGEWSWFRLIDKYGQLKKQTGKDSWMVAFDISGIKAGYQLLPGSVYNPFDQNDIRNFSLPERL
ncbi:type VI secretion system membrane subunit TssM [Oceanobacter mangrovi]|uniref:type VI secretion system membrane subunit TssM n=1 Tax=Oceanobacter mangrovi TaxID=2862510 RepID=UPI001C8DE2BC|nr:type VI secretion system membrane subunit TssM [Oceanobacter mangrovi]